MKFKSYQWQILLRVSLLFVVLTAAAFCVTEKKYTYLFVLLPVIIVQILNFFSFHYKAQKEIEQFAESIHYRDFTRQFDERHAPAELQPLRKGFNDINTTFQRISREKETQNVYLEKMLELVDTGILSYNTNTGNVVWMNESLRKMLLIPYLKTIDALKKRAAPLYNECVAIQPGNSRIVKLMNEHNSFNIVLSCTGFKTDGDFFKLIAFQNVNDALDETETNAWQKLLSVMTHEIMNSVAPISSLADTLKNRISVAKATSASDFNAMEDIEIGIETIKRRSEGLLKFAEVYRNLNKIAQANLKKVRVSDLFEHLYHLMQPTLVQKKIELETILRDTNLEIDADLHLLEQVFINLLLNSIEAVKESPDAKIQLLAGKENGKTLLQVADNGAGMAPELLEKIFIPFFSTKKNGSGIGLSLCKQIMLLHRGNIFVQSIEGKGTKFSLQF